MDKQEEINQFIASMLNRILTLLNHLLHKINRITLDIMRLEKEKQ
jgi:hypothetical protein